MTMAKVSVAVLLFAVACFGADDEGFYTEQDLAVLLSNETDVPMPQNETDVPLPQNVTDAPMPQNETDVPLPQNDTDVPLPETDAPLPETNAPSSDDNGTPVWIIIVACVGGAAVLAGAAFALLKCRAKTTPEHENLLEDPSVNTVSHVPGRPEELRRSVYDPSSDTHQTQDTEVVAE
eukprot:TRINITY_DN1843_c0_g1_i2.p1 TRINITY_DN1843_c0_g1~~TRINITY_DN1843_c0_g1_i2.p1  ORF type:complete len:204 (+),score=75.25 TRINITY_DN1843_c0_g1_i2:80-613(+)